MNFRRLVFPGLLLLLVQVAGCSDPAGPAETAFEITVLSGNGQLTSPGGELAEPLTVVVRRVRTGEPAADVTVHWEVVSGQGATLTHARMDTDSLGQSSVEARMGSEIGTYVVQADFAGRTGDPSRFEVFVVHEPEITEWPESALAGETVRLRGTHFRAEPAENFVLFSGFRGEVLSGREDELTVRVPPCLPTRVVDVSVALSPNVRGAPVPLQVEAQGEPLQLEVGEEIVVHDPEALSCVRLPSGTTARYLAVPHATSTLVGGRYDYGLFGLTGGALTAAAETEAMAPAGFHLSDDDLSTLPQARWDHQIRRLEGELLPARPGERTALPTRSLSSTPAPAPAVGERRSFKVLNRSQEFEEVTAEVVHVGERALLYQDITAPSGGFSASDFAEFAAGFDDTIHPAVTGVFGQPSDIDGNGRIIILFTPVVNRLTLSGSGGFVGGFFFGLDLLRGRDGSNEAEIFYTLVPDPDGELGDARSRDVVLRSVPAILAHEFQHMVHFNERVLVRDVSSTEALWLSEALAQMAEDVVSEVFAAQGEAEVARRYQSGNLQRARRYLADPAAISLTPVAGGGTIEERGAGWLFLRYLRGQAGGDNALLRALTQTTRTGVSNVRFETGRQWPELLSSWSAALYLDGLGLPVDSRLEFQDIDLRQTLTPQGERYPLASTEVGPGGFTRTGRLRASAPSHYLIRPGTGGTALTLAGPGGLPAPTPSGLQLTIVRLQ